ncbi:MAG: hypothetical protein BMS9Abin07_1138 [Acidimicrobiia bacterium]|nr:MAG: hypothetical protein BMS9Abin07_1138 [Acidimicrobiia bacterium]
MTRLWAAYQSRFIADEEGASMVEYALLIALIAMAVIAGAIFFGTELSEKFSEVGDSIDAAP